MQCETRTQERWKSDLREKRSRFQQAATEKAEVSPEPKGEELREISTARDEGKTFPAEGTLQSVSGARTDR